MSSKGMLLPVSITIEAMPQNCDDDTTCTFVDDTCPTCGKEPNAVRVTAMVDERPLGLSFIFPLDRTDATDEEWDAYVSMIASADQLLFTVILKELTR